jgi:hypothetical protein
MIRSFSAEMDDEHDKAPYTVVTLPMTGEEFLLLDPALKVRRHAVSRFDVDDPESFRAVAAEIAGGTRIVTLNKDGVFSYANAQGAAATASVAYALRRHPQSAMLCVANEKAFSQKALLQFHEQHPELLVPAGDDAGTAWDMVRAFKREELNKVEVTIGDEGIDLVASLKDTALSTRLPRFWVVTCPYYLDHAEFTVTVRLDVETPKPDEEGKLKGELLFKFALWAPEAVDVIRDAFDDAVQSMQDLLGSDYLVVRGTMSSSTEGN